MSRIEYTYTEPKEKLFQETFRFRLSTDNITGKITVVFEEYASFERPSRRHGWKYRTIWLRDERDRKRYLGVARLLDEPPIVWCRKDIERQVQDRITYDF